MVDAVLTASRVLVAIAARSLADVGEQVTLTQYRALVVLASRGPQNVAALAEALAVTPPTASRLCDRLVRKGLVRRRSDRRDRRQMRIALSESGSALIETVTARRRRRSRPSFRPSRPRPGAPWSRRCGNSPRAPGRCRSRTGTADGTSRRARGGVGRERHGGAQPGHGCGCRSLALVEVVSHEVARARRGHRRRRRPGGHRLLRGARLLHASLPRGARRLSGPDIRR